MYEFNMPKLGADMDEGILLEWKIAPGGHVNKGDIVAVVETSKGTIDIEAFVEGTVDSLIVKPNETAPVGTVMAHFRLSGEENTAGKMPTLQMEGKRTGTAANAPAATAKRAFPESNKSGVSVSPRARQLAKQLNVSLGDVKGTGPNASIVAEDVQAAARIQHAGSTSGEKAANKPLALRKAIAAAMSRSKREIPHYYLAHDVDVSPLLSFVENWNDSHEVAGRILPALLYYKAVGMAAKEFDSMNGTWTNDEFQPASTVNLGVAISLRGGGLMAPCLMDAASKSAVDLMRELKDLVTRTRKGGLRGSEMSEGTITVSNLGDRGVGFLAGVIYPPQVALVGIGSIRERPWVVDGKPGVRPVLTLSLAADHRVSDGHTGALFLRRIEQLIGTPSDLM